MLEAQRPLTLILGTIAAWSLALLVLTAFGLGGRVPPAAADGVARPLPALNLTPGVSRLGSLDQYAQVGNRPLLMPNRKPQPIAAAPGDASTSDLSAKLTSVLITPSLQLAILTLDEGGLSRRVRVGETVEGTNWRLMSLEPRRAVFDGPGGQKVLDLRVFDGQGGQAPTQVARVEGGRSTAESGGSDGADGGVMNPGNALPGAGATDAPTAAPIASTTPATPPGVPPNAPRTPNATTPERPMTQQEQVEAIRRRIEARRAQMRAQQPREADETQVK